MGDRETSPTWIRIYADDLVAGDLMKFTADGDAVRVLDRATAPAWTRIFRVRLGDGDTTTSLSKSAKIHVFDPDGSVARRVRAVLPESSG